MNIILSSFNEIAYHGDKCRIDASYGNHWPDFSNISIWLKPSESSSFIMAIFVVNDVFIS